MKPEDVRILVVDDDEQVLETITDLFRIYDFKVDPALGGRKAWALIKKNPYHIVISDVRMPDIDGLALTKLIKARDPVTPSVLFISGFSDVLNEELYHYGVEGLFAKPFDASAVKSAIQTCLLAPDAKWGRPIPTDIIFKINKKANSLAELSQQRSVLFGRGGLFMSYNSTLPIRGQVVGFKIEIAGPKPMVFSGAGIVQWTQKYAKGDVPPGVGLEITHMPVDQALIYAKMFGDRFHFIPSPKILSISAAA